MPRVAMLKPQNLKRIEKKYEYFDTTKEARRT